MTEAMTPTPLADAVELADKIDPRNLPVPPEFSRDWNAGIAFAGYAAVKLDDLIAASDMLRTLTPISDEEIAGLVGRLRELAGFQRPTAPDDAEISDEAATLLSRLHTRALLARGMAIEECARWHDRLAENYDGKAATDEYNKLRIMHRQSADALRSLSPSPDIDALVERAARTLAEGVWPQFNEHGRELYRQKARAVLTALIGER